MSSLPTKNLLWIQGGFKFVLTARSSFIAIYRVSDSYVPFDMAERPGQRTKMPSEIVFRAACVKWLIERSPLKGFGRPNYLGEALSETHVQDQANKLLDQGLL